MANIVFDKNANQIISDELHQKSNYAFFKSLIDDINNRYETRFAPDMQIYVTRLGIIISGVSSKHIKNNTYLGSIEYLCIDLLKNRNLYNMLRAVGINDEGNTAKHRKSDVNLDIEECVRQYNRLIQALIDLGLTAVSICRLKLQAVDYRDQKVFEEKYEEKYGSLAGTKFAVKLSKNVKLDPYEKTITTNLTVSWPNSNSKRYFNIEVLNNNKVIGKKDNVSLANGSGFQNFTVCVKENQLDRKKLTVQVRLSLVEEKEKYYTTGILFWKKTHSYTTQNDVDSTEVTVSIII